MKTPSPATPRIPRATYRFQFNRNFTLPEATDLVKYLDALGISDCYASPLFLAPEESNHGYDLCDYNRLNPTLGTPEQFEQLVAELHENGLGLLLDFVPNHMGAHVPLNPWWTDVLEHGRRSRFSNFFDIRWDDPPVPGKILLPVLGAPYGEILHRGEFKIVLEHGKLWVAWFDHRFPVNPESYSDLLRAAAKQTADTGASDLSSLADEISAAAGLLPDSQKEIETRAEAMGQAFDRFRAVAESPLGEAIRQACHTLEGQTEQVETFAPLHAFLEAQWYRLAYWRYATSQLNYRRFFEIDTLAGVRMERPEVFQAAHQMLLQWVRDGKVTGIRIDHVDGLLNPVEYLKRLQEAAGKVLNVESGDKQLPIYLLVEKILMEGERLRETWPVHGTTGYNFTSQLANVLIDADAEGRFTELYQRFTSEAPAFDDHVYEKKKLVTSMALSNEIAWLGRLASRVAQEKLATRDFSTVALTNGIRELIACFGVYRTYLEPGQPVHPDDRKVIERAVAEAQRRNPAIEAELFQFLQRTLLGASSPAAADLLMRFQQCTGPIMAKSFEDTVFFVSNRLNALNEVGGSPDKFGGSVQEFHVNNQTRLQELPHSMLASSTHDTKTSEDVRARLAALSEMPDLWETSIQHWRALNAPHKRTVQGRPAPDSNEEYLLYQMLVGSWEQAEPDKTYVERLQAYMAKATREAKVNTSWTAANAEWDEAVQQFVAAILSPDNRQFLEYLDRVAGIVARPGALNSLSQTLLKLTVPGVPDIYQGTEIWNYSLVDPDNRRKVDYKQRQAMLEELKSATAEDLLNHWEDGRIKLYLISKVLGFRGREPELFKEGSYEPLVATGPHMQRMVAFARRSETARAIVLAPRLTSGLGFPGIKSAWAGTTLTIPETLRGTYRDLFTGEKVTLKEEAIPLDKVLKNLPFALLTQE